MFKEAGWLYAIFVYDEEDCIRVRIAVVQKFNGNLTIKDGTV